jgi:hypothetical protein
LLTEGIKKLKFGAIKGCFGVTFCTNLIKFYDGMDEDLANPNLQPGIGLYQNRGVILSPIVAGFLSTHNKEETFTWVLLY